MLEPSEEYRKSLDARLETIAARERQHILLGYLKLAAIAAIVVLAWVHFARHLFNGYWLLAPVGAYAVLAVVHEQVLRARTHAETAGKPLPQGDRADRGPLERHGSERRSVPRRQARLCGRSRRIRPRLLIRAAFDSAHAHGRKPFGRVVAFAISRARRHRAPGFDRGTAPETGTARGFGDHRRRSAGAAESGIADDVVRERSGSRRACWSAPLQLPSRLPPLPASSISFIPEIYGRSSPSWSWRRFCFAERGSAR